MNFNEFLLERRKKISKSQKDVSEDISYSPQVISKWEKGLSVPNVDIVFLLCYSLEISLDDFFSYEVNAPIYKDIDPKAVVSLDGIKKNRRDKNLTQKQLAELINSNEVQIMRYEKGDSFPNIETFIAIAQALSLKPSELLLNTAISPQIPKMSKKKKLALIIGSTIGAISIAAAVAVPIVLLNQKDPTIPQVETRVVTIDANGGQFSDGTTKLYQTVELGSILPAFEYPTKEGNHISKWTIENETIDLSSYTVTDNTTITANWDLSSYKVTVINDSSCGMVEGDGTYLYGDEVTLRATHTPNHKFAGWYENDILISQESIYTFTLGALDRTIETKWISVDYLVEVTTISPNTIGKINTDVSGRYLYGEEVKLTATVIDDNYVFVGWYSGDECLSPLKEWTYIVQDKDIQITAEFSQKQLEYLFYPEGAQLSSIGNCRYEKDIVIPAYTPTGEKVTSIAYGAFEGVKDTLESVYLPDGIAKIGSQTFMNFNNLKKARLPEDLEVIPNDMFYGCTSLNEVNIPNALTVINSGSFLYTKSLNASLTIPSGVNYIGTYAFSESGINNIVFECEKTVIDWNAFSKCPNLREIELPIISERDDGQFGAEIFSQSGVTKVSFREEQAAIGANWFSSCPSLEEVCLSSTIKTIEADAFSDTKNLKRINLPDGLEVIGSGSFSGCESLKSIFIPDSVSHIYQTPFSGCSSLTIYCESSTKKDGWNASWSKGSSNVIWNAKRSDVPNT